MRFPYSIAAVCLAACGASTDSPTTDGATELTVAVACGQLSAARCTKLQSCSPDDLERRFGDLATCETREALACTGGLAAAMTAATPTSAASCGAAISAESCPDFFSKAPPTACTTAMGAGTSTCEFAAQCASGYCALSSDSLCGTCLAQPVAGDPCDAQGCGQNLVCVSSTLQCQAPVAAGGACSKDLPCEDGFTCVGATSTESGACTADISTSGAACDPKHKTGADCSADAGLTCNTMTLVCGAMPIAAAGAACGLIANVVTRCSGGASCTIPTGMTAGTCVAPAADGAACDLDVGPGCLTPAKCVGGTCQLPGSATCL